MEDLSRAQVHAEPRAESVEVRGHLLRAQGVGPFGADLVKPLLRVVGVATARVRAEEGLGLVAHVDPYGPPGDARAVHADARAGQEGFGVGGGVGEALVDALQTGEVGCAARAVGVLPLVRANDPFRGITQSDEDAVVCPNVVSTRLSQVYLLESDAIRREEPAHCAAACLAHVQQKHSLAHRPRRRPCFHVQASSGGGPTCKRERHDEECLRRPPHR
mmetsp:Transcript_16124/g.54196  ORF Transcript_16124/g.54196 Transcript_16124/m.54196 type:complete len:218 (+) Transcript_16124:247-900(+)